MKNKLSIAMTLAVIMAMLVTSLALADQVGVDNDVVSPGNQSSVTLTVSPGASVTTSAQLVVDYQGSSHLVAGSNLVLQIGTNNLPVGYNVSEVSTTVPNPWNSTVDLFVAGNSSITFTAPTNPDSYVYTVKWDDKTKSCTNTQDCVSSGNAFTINLTVSAPVKTTPTITWANPANIVYGTALSSTQLNATASVSGTFVYTPAAETVLNAGAGQTLHVDFIPDDTTKYNNTSKDVTINVLKAAPGCSISGYTGTYDGTTHGASGSCTGEGTLDLGNTFTDVPGGTASWTFTGGVNYNDDSGSVEIVINKASSTVTVSCPASVTYNGSAQTPCTAAATGAGGLNETLTITYSNNTNAGTATASASYGGDTNHDGSNSSATFEIEKANASCTVDGYDVTYDGTEHVATGSCLGVMNEALNGLDLNGTKHTDAGNYNDTWTFTDVTGNYKNTGGNVTDNIAKAPVTSTAGSGSGTYNGSAHSPSACALTGAYTGDLTCANNPASVGPNAGVYTIVPVVSGTGLSNFDITLVNGSYTINKADATINVSGYTGYYDGSFHCATGSATGVLNEDLSAGLNFGTCYKDVPGDIAHWTFSGGTNYNDANGDVAINILAWTLTGFYKPVDMPNTSIVWNTIKAGQTVPLKFNVYAGTVELIDTGVVKSFAVTKVACPGDTLDEAPVEFTTTGGTSLRYDITAGQFVQNWQTPKGANACYRVTLTTQDLSTIIAFFKTK